MIFDPLHTPLYSDIHICVINLHSQSAHPVHPSKFCEIFAKFQIRVSRNYVQILQNRKFSIISKISQNQNIVLFWPEICPDFQG